MAKYIYCKYHEEGELGSYCFAPKGCIYQSFYQINVDKIKGCRVNGTINPKDIPENMKRKLSEEDLVARIETRLGTPF